MYAIIQKILLIIFLSILTYCTHAQQLPTDIIRIPDKNIELLVELATTPQTRSQGFMHRRTITQGTGMLFAFKTDQVLSFWMKNTPTPLSIAYITYDGRIVSIHHLQAYSLQPVSSNRAVRYALEVPQGDFEHFNITVGDVISLPPLPHIE